LEKEAKNNLRALDMARAQNEQSISEFTGRERGADRRTAAELAASREYRKELAGLKREELNTKKLAQIAMIPNKEMREKALMEILGGIAGGEDVDDLIAKYR